MTARVKICGVNSAAAFDAAHAAGADWIGFVFFPPSPRSLTPQAAAALSARATGGALRVGLFVAPDNDAIDAALRAMRLDVLQLHDVSATRALDLRRRTGLAVWRAVGVSGTADLPRDTGGVDAVLLDAKPPPDAALPGGNAHSFDWSVLQNWHPDFPWLLAGGLTPANVATAIRETGAVAVDVSSGVESARGVKDPAMIADFIRAAKSSGSG